MEKLINLKEEERCGYVVEEKLKKIWNVQLNMLTELLQVCEKHHLRIFAYAGTLLGAVRHHGFIPWDDDMDVAMPRGDYEKLLEVAPKEFDDPLFLQTASNDRKFFCAYARLRNSGTTGMITWNASDEYNNGIFIDIYPLDGYTDNGLLLTVQVVRKSILEQLMKVYYADGSYQARKPKWLTRMIQMLAHRKPYDYWLLKYNDELKRYNTKADKLSLITHEKRVIRKYWCYSEDVASTEYMQFESLKVPVPHNYDEVLTHTYGDYMKFPDPALRGKWHENMIVYDPDTPYKKYIQERYRRYA